MLLEWLGMAGEGVSGLAGLSQVGVLGGGGGEGDGLTVEGKGPNSATSPVADFWNI